MLNPRVKWPKYLQVFVEEIQKKIINGFIFGEVKQKSTEESGWSVKRKKLKKTNQKQKKKTNQKRKRIKKNNESKIISNKKAKLEQQNFMLWKLFHARFAWQFLIYVVETRKQSFCRLSLAGLAMLGKHKDN